MSMTFEAIMKDLKAGNYQPVYFLQGDEVYFIDKISDYIAKHALDEASKGFNQTVLYGKDVDSKTLLDVVMRYPMMAAKQVVILKEAQQMRGLENLMAYFENPAPTTIFVVCHKYKKIRKGTKLQKAIAKNAVFFDAKKLWDNQLPGFIKTMNPRVDQQAAMLLTEYLGNDLSKIETELEKLEINTSENQPITVNEVERFIGISKEYNVFEFSGALASRNKEKAFRIVDYFVSNPKANNPIMVSSYLYGFLSKALCYYPLRRLNEREAMGKLKAYPNLMKDLKNWAAHYSVQQTERAIEVLMEYDLKFKGVNSVALKKEELLKEMLYKMIY